MGMFSEIAASITAKELERILFIALETNNNDVISFCKDHLYPMYLNECGEAWKSENPELKRAFDNS